MYVSVVKLVHISRTQISTDGKCLEHCHVLNIAENCYDIQLVVIELDQYRVKLYDPN
jgi:hypothetical protein